MSSRYRALGALAFALLATSSFACSSEDAAVSAGESAASRSGPPKLCAAVRGNGPLIGAHFASLARIVEHYGVVDGMAGGSSASITTFLYDSMLANPAISRCGDAPCGEAEKAARVSLALKSLQGYAHVLVTSEEGVAIGDFAATASKVKQRIDEEGIVALASSDGRAAAAKLKTILEVPEVRAIVNPELLDMLVDHPPRFAVNEVIAALTTVGSFSADDNRLFFRPGAIDWGQAATLMGRIGDFYAGQGVGAASAEPMAAWLDACATPSTGADWVTAAGLPMGDATCGAAFGAMLTDYRARARASTDEPVRLSAKIGAPSAVSKLVSTSVLEGDAVAAYRTALAAYESGAHPSGNIPLSLSFDDVRFGYWGSARDVDAVLADGERFGDRRTQKATSLGDATWRQILMASPAEPGLSRLVDLPDGRISAGGWSDLSPSLALKNVGCERVVLVTREGSESRFATGVATLLGMNDVDRSALYDLGSASSSATRALENADAVWCTNWDSFSIPQQAELFADAWSAPAEIRTSFRGSTILKPYPNASAQLDKVGCSPRAVAR